MSTGVLTIRELVTKLGFDVDFGPLNAVNDRVADTKEGLEGMGAAADEAANQVKGALTTIRNLLLGFTAATAAGAVSLFAMAKTTANVGDEINKTAPLLGFSVEEFQKYRYAAKLAGVENENFAGSTQLLLRNIEEARNGNKELEKSFARAGLSSARLKGLSTAQVLREVSDGLAGISDEATRISVSMDLMGRSGARMGAFLAKGTAAMDELMADVEAFGMFTAESAQASEDLNDSLDRVIFFIRGIKNELAIKLLPVFRGMLDDFREWLSLNREIIKSRITKFAELLASALTTAWNVVKRVVRTVETVIGILGGLENAFYLLAIAITAPLLLLLGPLFLVGKAALAFLFPMLQLHTVITLVTFALSTLAPILTIFVGAVSALAAAKLISWLVAAAGGFTALGAAIILPTLALLAQAAALALIILFFEDLTTWILGGKSLMGEWLGEWAKIPDKLRGIWADIKAVFREGGAFIAAVFRGDFREAYRMLEEGAGKVNAAMAKRAFTGKAPTYMDFISGAGGYGGMAPYGGPGFGASMAGNSSGPLVDDVGRRLRAGETVLLADLARENDENDRRRGITQNVKAEINAVLAKGTSKEQADEIVGLVRDELDRQVNHSLQQSVPPGR